MKKVLLLILFITGLSYSQADYYYYYSNNSGLEPLTANSNTVVWGPYTPVIAIATDSTNLGSTNSSTFTDYINTGNYSRIRQGYGLAGDVLTSVQLYIGDYEKITFAQVRIWRRNQITGTYTMIGSAMINPTSNGSQSFPVSIPNVKEGDFIGVRLKTTASALNIRSGNANLTVYKKDNADSTAVTFSTTVANSYVPVIVSGQAPAIVFFGNSLLGGSVLHYPYTYASQISQVDYTWTTVPNYASYKFGIPYQNYSYPGDASSTLLSNISGVINLYPKIVVFENSNDRNNGTAGTGITNQRAIIDSLTAHGIKVVYWMIPPVNSSNATMLRRDTIRNDISAYTLSKGGYVFNSDPSLGIQRDTGTPTPTTPNYWNIKSGYSPDGAHYNDFGYKEAGRLIDSLLSNYYTLIDTTLIYNVHNPVYTGSQYSPITVYDTVHCYPIKPDSVVIIYSVNGGASQRSSMTFSDSIPLTNTYNYSKALSVTGSDGNTVSYAITTYQGTRTGTSSTKSFTLGVYPDYVATPNYLWEYTDLSDGAVTTWLNQKDTLTLRQGTTANKPIKGSTGVTFDTTDVLLCNMPHFNTKDSFTVMIYMQLPDTNAPSTQRIFAYRHNTSPVKLLTLLLQTNTAQPYRKFGSAYYDNAGQYNRTFLTSLGSANLGFAVYTVILDSNSKQLLDINNVTGSDQGNASNYGTNVSGFGLGNTDGTVGMKNGVIKRILIYYRKLSAAEILTNYNAMIARP